MAVLETAVIPFNYRPPSKIRLELRGPALLTPMSIGEDSAGGERWFTVNRWPYDYSLQLFNFFVRGVLTTVFAELLQRQLFF